MDEEKRVEMEVNGTVADDSGKDAPESFSTSDPTAEKTKKQEVVEPKWVTAKLVMGILSIILFVFVMFQSCAAGLSNALSDNGEVSGSAGFICAINFLISGLIAIVARKSVKKAAMIVAAVFLWLSLLFAKMMAGSYSDLVIWGYLSFAFGLVYLLSVMRTKKQYLITAVVAVIVLVLSMAMGGGTSASASENKGTADADAATLSAGDQGKPAEEVNSTDSSNSEESADSVQNAVQNPEEGETSWDVKDGIVNAYTDSIGSHWVQLAVPVVNTGRGNLYMSAGTMDLEDEEGHLVDSRQLISVFPQVIKPGETAWYYESIIMEEEPPSGLSVVPHVDVSAAKVDCIRYATSDVSFTDSEYNGIKVTGRVENNTDEDGSMVYVVILMYDSDENLLGNAFTILDEELKAGETMGFSAIEDGESGLQVQDVANYRIYAYPMQYQF